MKVSLYRKDNRSETLHTLELDALIEKLKTETKQRPVSRFREELRYYTPGRLRRVPRSYRSYYSPPRSGEPGRKFR